jgi:hypothetical protein
MLNEQATVIGKKEMQECFKTQSSYLSWKEEVQKCFKAHPNISFLMKTE